MRIIIQNPVTQAYFDGDCWNGELAYAMDFETTADAEKFCQNHSLSDAWIVVKFKDESADICFRAGSRTQVLTAEKPTV